MEEDSEQEKERNRVFERERERERERMNEESKEESWCSENWRFATRSTEESAGRELFDPDAAATDTAFGAAIAIVPDRDDNKSSGWQQPIFITS